MSERCKTVRVFLSSTFRDMHTERDHLARMAFPKLKKRCRKWRISHHMGSPNIFDFFDPSNYGSTPVAEFQFMCHSCSESAGVVQLYGTENSSLLVRSSFIGKTSGSIKPEYFEKCRGAIASGDAFALYCLNWEWAPFYCPKCNQCFCGKHWQWRPVFEYGDWKGGWYDYTEGICPKGHERIMGD